MRKTIAALGLLAALLMLAGGAAAQEKKEYILGIHFASIGGISSSEFYDLAHKPLEVIANDLGFVMKLKTFPSFDEAGAAFEKDKLDAALLTPTQVLDTLDKSDKAYLMATYVTEKRRKMALCLWQKRPGYMMGFSDVRGKRLLLEEVNIFSLIQLRSLLYDNGIDEPLREVFKSFIAAPSSNSAFMALAMGDADFLLAGEDNEFTLKLISPGLVKQVGYSLCTERIYGRNTVVFNKKTVSAKNISNFRRGLEESLKNFNDLVKKYNDIRTLNEFMKMVKMKFIPAAPDEFKTDLALYRRAKKNGWYEEAKAIAEKMRESPVGRPVEFRMSFDECRAACAGAKDRMACVDECMK